MLSIAGEEDLEEEGGGGWIEKRGMRLL